MELAKPRPHHHPFHFVRTFAFTTCQVTSSFHFGETFKEQWARSTQCGHDLCYTVLINRDSFFHNKRCRRSNYSVKHIRSQGGRYSVLSAGTGRSVKEQLSEMPKLFEGKLVFFFSRGNRAACAKASHEHRHRVLLDAKAFMSRKVHLNLFFPFLTSSCGRKSQCHF